MSSLEVLEHLRCAQDFDLVASATHTLEGYALIHDIAVTEHFIVVFQVKLHLLLPRVPTSTTSHMLDLGCSCFVCTPKLLRIAGCIMKVWWHTPCACMHSSLSPTCSVQVLREAAVLVYAQNPARQGLSSGFKVSAERLGRLSVPETGGACAWIHGFKAVC